MVVGLMWLSQHRHLNIFLFLGCSKSDFLPQLVHNFLSRLGRCPFEASFLFSLSFHAFYFCCFIFQTLLVFLEQCASSFFDFV